MPIRSIIYRWDQPRFRKRTRKSCSGIFHVQDFIIFMDRRKLDAFLDEMAEEFTKEAVALEKEPVEEDLPVINHGFNILRLKKYDQDKLVQSLHTDILEQLDRTRHTLDSLSWLIKSDVNRAKIVNREVHIVSLAAVFLSLPVLQLPVWLLLPVLPA